MKGLNKLGKVITKILEVFHWVGAAFNDGGHCLFCRRTRLGKIFLSASMQGMLRCEPGCIWI